MRIPTIAGALAAFVLIAGHAHAAPYQGQWCAQMPIGDDAVSERCDLRTFEACRREIVATGGNCVLNPYYRGPAPADAQRPRARQPRPR